MPSRYPTSPPCPICGTTLDTDWIDVHSLGDPHPVYIPGEQRCTNGCDLQAADLLKRNHDDQPIWHAGRCVSLGLNDEIRRIVGDPNATLRSVITDPDRARRTETLRRIRITADRLDTLARSEPAEWPVQF